jgi:hypothetical protein
VTSEKPLAAAATQFHTPTLSRTVQMSLLQYLAHRCVIDVFRDRLSFFREGVRGYCHYSRACRQAVSVHLVDGVAGLWCTSLLAVLKMNSGTDIGIQVLSLTCRALSFRALSLTCEIRATKIHNCHRARDGVMQSQSGL